MIPFRNRKDCSPIVMPSRRFFPALMGEDVESRRKFIEDNALHVKNLDI